MMHIESMKYQPGNGCSITIDVAGECSTLYAPTVTRTLQQLEYDYPAAYCKPSNFVVKDYLVPRM